MINRKSIVNSPDDRLRQFNQMPIPMWNPGKTYDTYFSSRNRETSASVFMPFNS